MLISYNIFLGNLLTGKERAALNMFM